MKELYEEVIVIYQSIDGKQFDFSIYQKKILIKSNASLTIASTERLESSMLVLYISVRFKNGD